MDIHTLWGIRHMFEDEAPELMVAWDSETVENNPEGFKKACQDERDAWGDDLVKERFVIIEVPKEGLEAAFQAPVIQAKIQS